MRLKLTVIIISLLTIIFISGTIIFLLVNRSQPPTINSFAECANFNPVMESYPRQCRTTDGRLFVEQIILEDN